MSREFDFERLEFYRKRRPIGPTLSDQLSLPASVDETGRIRPAPSDQSPHSSSASVAGIVAQLREEFVLGWSHYVTLLSVSNPDARRFHEIEAADNGWSVRELKRQLDSSLYERLALSRDKHEVRRLACEGQVVEKASDLITDPAVLEFLERRRASPTPRQEST